MKKALLLSFLTAGAVSLVQGGVVIYQQGFSNNTGSNQAIGDFEWFQNSIKSDGTNFVIYNGTQNLGTHDGPTVAPNVNAVTPYGDNIALGLMFVSPQQGTDAGRTVSWTNDADIQVDVSTLESVSMDTGVNTSNAGNGFRIAVQIADQWYVQSSLTQPSQTSGANFDSNADAYTFNWTNTAANWNTISFVENTSLSQTLGAVGSDLSGTVQSIGFWTETTGNFGQHWDNFTVTVVPEPSTYAMLAGLLALGLVMVRRRLS
ncbi:MAG: PEP-CTERM sorting domain-containing protein [Oceanipulchritudo sp.]